MADRCFPGYSAPFGEPLPSIKIIESLVTTLKFNEQIKLILDWSKQNIAKYVCIANTHMLVEAYKDSGFANVLNRADLVTADGMPLVWMMKLLGISRPDRVAGMDVFLSICQEAQQQDVSVFFLGSEPSILRAIETRLKREFPSLKVAALEPLPFRPLKTAEDVAVVDKINRSGAGIVFISLGCPKQEKWMYEHKDNVQAVMLGLGAVFPIYAGLKKPAPEWMRQSGLEWLHRLAQEPQRLWNRYFTTIPLFLWLSFKQLLVS